MLFICSSCPIFLMFSKVRKSCIHYVINVNLFDAYSSLCENIQLKAYIDRRLCNGWWTFSSQHFCYLMRRRYKRRVYYYNVSLITLKKRWEYFHLWKLGCWQDIWWAIIEAYTLFLLFLWKQVRIFMLILIISDLSAESFIVKWGLYKAAK